MTTFDAPILVGGLAGSGKTPVRRLLDAHPSIAMTRRTYLWTRFQGQFGDLTVRENLERCLATVLAAPGVEQLQPDEDRLRADLAGGPISYGRLFGLLHQHHAERLGARRWGDQLAGVERFADEVFAAYPRARMIHMVRRPWAGSDGGATTGGRPGRRRLAATARWGATLAVASRNRRRHAGRYLVVSGEELRAEPRAVAGRICAFVDEQPGPEMEEAIASLISGCAPPRNGGDPPFGGHMPRSVRS